MSLDARPSDAELLRMAEERAAKRHFKIADIAYSEIAPSVPEQLTTSPQRERASRSKKRPSPTEHAEQVALFRWIDDTARVTIDPAFGFIYAIPNGGHRTPAVAAKLKAEGVRAGYPDIAWDLARGPYTGFRGELKRAGSGVVSPLQAEWHVWLERQGLYVVTAHGSDAMREQLLWYFHLPPRP